MQFIIILLYLSNSLLQLFCRRYVSQKYQCAADSVADSIDTKTNRLASAIRWKEGNTPGAALTLLVLTLDYHHLYRTATVREQATPHAARRDIPLTRYLPLHLLALYHVHW